MLGHKVKAILRITVGVGITFYGVAGVFRYGFYISGRGDPGQVQGGLGPFFIFLGVLIVIYAAVEYSLRKR